MDTIVTCDNGIAALKEITYAKSLGMTVVVTDHHEIPYEEAEDGSPNAPQSREKNMGGIDPVNIIIPDDPHGQARRRFLPQKAWE